jgi:hypothetical protein
MYFILIGLPVGSPRVPEHLHDMVRKGLEQNYNVFKEAGIEYKDCFLEPEDGTKPLLELIKQRKPDGIVVGFGVRGSNDQEITFFLEKIVNDVQRKYPQTTIMFNVSPDSTLAAVRRWFPNA